MYNYILDQIKNKKININNKLGKNIIKNYLKFIIGGQPDDENMEEEEYTEADFLSETELLTKELRNLDNSNLRSYIEKYFREKIYEQDEGLYGWIPIEEWNTVNVTNMKDLFKADTYPSDIHDGILNFNKNLSKWKTQNVTNMDRMFCSAVNFNNGAADGETNNKLSFNTKKVLSMTGMFKNAKKFNQELLFDTKQVTSMSEMFNGADSFNNGIIPKEGVTDWNFNSDVMPNYKPLEFDISNVADMSFMFSEAKSFNQELKFTPNKVDTQTKLVNMWGMFKGATNFNNGQISRRPDLLGTHAAPLELNTINVIHMNSMFVDAITFNQELKLSTDSVHTMNRMFYNAASFNNGASVDSGVKPLKFNTHNVRDMNMMFMGGKNFNQSLKDDEDKPWDTSRVTTMQSMFEGCDIFNNGQRPGFGGTYVLPSCELNLNTRIVTNMKNMFMGAKKFNQKINFDTSEVTNMSEMFTGAEMFNNSARPGQGGKPLNFKISKVRFMNHMFYKASSFNQPLDLPSVIEKVQTNMMYEGTDIPLNLRPVPLAFRYKHDGIEEMGSLISQNYATIPVARFESVEEVVDALRKEKAMDPNIRAQVHPIPAGYMRAKLVNEAAGKAAEA